MLVSVIDVPPAAFHRVRGHLLVKRFALIPAVRDKRISDSKPFPLDGNCKGFAFISFVPVRKIAECFQRNLHLVILFREQLFPNGQRCIVYPAVDCMIGVRTDGRLVILRQSQDDGVHILYLGGLCIWFGIQLNTVYLF